MTPPQEATSLSEFLRERLEARHVQEWEDGWLIALHVAGWRVAAKLPYVNRAARRKAAEFADHPGYNPDWRP